MAEEQAPEETSEEKNEPKENEEGTKYTGGEIPRVDPPDKKK